MLNMPKLMRMMFDQLRCVGVDISRLTNSKRMATDSSYAISKLLKERSVKTVFDVGANIGQTAKSYRRIFPNATIHSFEPSDETYSSLVEACRSDSQIIPWQFAVSDVNGTKKFFINDDQTTSSLLAPSDEINNSTLRAKHKLTGCSSVECITLDKFCSQQSIDNIDLLKMDIQGAELQAISGASELFRANRIGVVFCEVLFSKLYKNAADFAQIYNAMNGHGFILYGLYNTHHFESDGLLWGDAIFLHPSLLPIAGEQKLSRA